MIMVSTAVKTKKDHSFTRSANVPETIDAVVATKTIWKNQSDMTEYWFAAAASAAAAISGAAASAATASSSAQLLGGRAP